MATSLTPTTSNVSNELIASFALEADRAQREIDEASGRKRAVLKRAKAAGLNTVALLSAVRMKKADEESVSLSLRDMLRYAAIIAPAVPLRQSDLFDATPAKPLNLKMQKEMQSWDAEQKGYDCGLHGGTMDDAVYAAGTDAYTLFRVGFERGQRVIAERMGENARVADSGRDKRRGKMAAAADDSDTESMNGADA